MQLTVRRIADMIPSSLFIGVIVCNYMHNFTKMRNKMYFTLLIVSYIRTRYNYQNIL